MSPVSLESWAQDDWGLGLCSSVTACALPRDCSVVQLVLSFHATGCPRVVYVSMVNSLVQGDLNGVLSWVVWCPSLLEVNRRLFPLGYTLTGGSVMTWERGQESHPRPGHWRRV